ncbi:MAG: tagaturonate reductase [Bifidobacteriaceae bacterium]|jgi:tagaturonate reductase|nr:tagaturonate reductase [Bifidobacteriaceae bacterium]
MLKKLNRQTFSHYLDSEPSKIILFGEGNFLRAFIGFIVENLNRTSQFNGVITAVQPIDKGMSELINSQDGLYTIITKGLLDKRTINTSKLIHSLKEVINPYVNHKSFLKLAEDENYKIVISNTTEAGISISSGDEFHAKPPISYPAKLTQLLYKKWLIKSKPFIFLPCELIEDNAQKLLNTIITTAKKWHLEADFINWVKNDNIFCSTLVDRIVPGYPKNQANQIWQELGYQDELLVETEPFLLWVIEANQETKNKILKHLPLDKFNSGQIIFTDDLSAYRTRKVSLLNGSHTFMVPLGLLSNINTVKQVIDNPALATLVKKVMKNEISPVLDLPSQELKTYCDSVLERFSNPFIEHKLKSIALNSLSKWVTRLLPTVLLYDKKFTKLPHGIILSFAALLKVYNQADKFAINDNSEHIKQIQNIFAENTNLSKAVEQILKLDNIWGQNLNRIPNLTNQLTFSLNLIEQNAVNLAIEKVLPKI